MVITGKELDAMNVEETKAYIDSIGPRDVDGLFEHCTFACIKRTYEKYFGFRLTSTKTRERAIFEFKEAKWDRHRAEVLLG